MRSRCPGTADRGRQRPRSERRKCAGGSAGRIYFPEHLCALSGRLSTERFYMSASASGTRRRPAKG
jgi:hypothetical protein